MGGLWRQMPGGTGDDGTGIENAEEALKKRPVSRVFDAPFTVCALTEGLNRRYTKNREYADGRGSGGRGGGGVDSGLSWNKQPRECRPVACCTRATAGRTR